MTDVSYHEGMWVWVPHKSQVWSPAVISLSSKENDQYIVLHKSGEKESIKSENIHSIISWEHSEGEGPSFYFHSDLSKMSCLSTPAVLHSLKQGYECGVYYRKLGAGTILSINPFQDVGDMFKLKVMHAYHSATMSELASMPAHVFVVVERALRDIQNSSGGSNQSVIISGESGAGKTWTVCCLMRYLAVVGMNNFSNSSDEDLLLQPSMENIIEKRILNSNPLLEAFGNARTPRNHNSSRFGKYIKLQYNRDGRIIGATLQVYLLEKSRVSSKRLDQANYHIFYQMLNGSTEEERQMWSLVDLGESAGLNDNANNNIQSIGDGQSIGKSSHNFMETRSAFQETRDAMLSIGISLAEQTAVFKVLSALLHLRQVKLEGDTSSGNPCEPTKRSIRQLELTAKLLGLHKQSLIEAVTRRRIEAGRSNSNKRRSVLHIVCSERECEARLDALVKCLYELIFHWIVNRIVDDLSSPADEVASFIGLLDVYGFECFEQNGLEQLCINYANEKLQSYYVENFLKLQQEVLAEEEIEWKTGDSQDGIGCLDSLESLRGSLFSLLNEECRLNRPSDPHQLRDRVCQHFPKNPHIKQPRISSPVPCFVVQHFAGAVTYITETLTSRNKDEVPSEIIKVLSNSSEVFVKSLLERRSYRKDHVKRGKHNETVLVNFKKSLDDLLRTMSQTQCHYVRCIKPNKLSAPNNFDSFHIVEQLRSSGVIETIRICEKLLPHRMKYRQFVALFAFALKLWPLADQQEAAHSALFTSAPDALLQVSRDISRFILSSHQDLDLDKSCQFGRTCIFMNSHFYQAVRNERLAAERLFAGKIQVWWKQVLHVRRCRRKVKEMVQLRHQAAIVLQTTWQHIQVVRKCKILRKRLIQQRHIAALIIQRSWIRKKKNDARRRSAVKPEPIVQTKEPQQPSLDLSTDMTFVDTSFNSSVDDSCDDRMNVFHVRTVRTQRAVIEARSTAASKDDSLLSRAHSTFGCWLYVYPSIVLNNFYAFSFRSSPMQLLKNTFLGNFSTILFSMNGTKRPKQNSILPFSNVIPKYR